MIFAAIVAGGVGSRMNISTMPKQFLPLGNKPIIIYTLEKFLLSEKLDYIYIGVHSSWISHMKELLDEFNIDKSRIRISQGGADRNSTIFNIIADIEKEFGESDENIDAALKYGACNTVIPEVDTIIVSEDGNTISDMPDRSKIYHSQTPQSFNINLLKRLYNALSDEEKLTLTDSCKICFIGGVEVKLLKGDASNMKITTVGDYNIAKAIAENIYN